MIQTVLKRDGRVVGFKVLYGLHFRKATAQPAPSPTVIYHYNPKKGI